MSHLTPCPNCPRVRTPVPGEGPTNAEIMGIAESPGKDEDAKGGPFRGKTGKEINELYLPLGGLDRRNIYLTNACKCWPRSDRDISPAIVESCAGFHLRQELMMVRPKVVILMGAVACSLVGLSVDMHHGRPFNGEILGHKCLIWPMYHPSLGMHDYAMMNAIMDDWKDLGRWLRGEELNIPVDEYPVTSYQRIRRGKEVAEVLDMYQEDCPIAIDTEFDDLGTHVDPYCLTFCCEPGQGFMIKDEDREAVAEFSKIIGRRHKVRGATRGPVIFHHSLADLPVVTTMGLDLTCRQIKDTMMMSYNLMTLPQGLKTLAFRLCGMEMLEYNDLVTPYAVEYWLAYIEGLATVEWPKPEPYMRDVVEKIPLEIDGVVVGETTTIVEKLYKPQSLSTKIKRLLTDYRKKPGPEVFDRWKDWGDREKAGAIELFGDMPRKSIRMVSDEKALLDYAVRDADATFRVYPVLKMKLKNFRKDNPYA